MTQNGRSTLPAKLYFRIGEVADLVGVEPHVLRYWEREFRSIRPTKSAKGQRVYSRKDVENLLRVKELLYRDGFTIAGAKKKLQRGGVEPEIERAFAPHARAASTQLPLIPHASRPERVEAQAPMAVVVATPLREAPVASSMLTQSTPEPPPRVREKLTALRAEVEAFLAELSKSH